MLTGNVSFVWFYDDSILSGTKTAAQYSSLCSGFMMTQFFQVLKLKVKKEYTDYMFYDDSILSGTKTSNTTFYIKVKHMYLSFA